jgi:hypothetical protein
MESCAAATPPNPPQDDSASSLPNNIAVVLHAARILLDYGRHLIDTVRHRATAPDFNAIAACFGTANLSTILAHLNRGILRATALERVLLARAAKGQDIDFIERHITTPEPQPAPAAAGQPAPTPRKCATRPSRPAGWDDPEFFMPTLQDLERQARRRPIGRTIQEICLDLAVVPGFCHSLFWNELFDIMTWFGGSVTTLMRQKSRRREAFAQQQDRKPDRQLGLAQHEPERTPSGPRLLHRRAAAQSARPHRRHRHRAALTRDVLAENLSRNGNGPPSPTLV